MDIEEISADLSAFSDDEGDVAIEASGEFMLIRGGREVSGKLFEDAEGRTWVEAADDLMPYRQFLTHKLASLDVLAQRLLARRSPVDSFVDSMVVLRQPTEEPRQISALRALQEECTNGSPFATRVSFITADAGHGKTALLRKHQFDVANQYSQGRSGYLFLHLDLQGRQLLRLSEALMGDLGDLRVGGLWMSALLRLMRNRALILAVDGFDELAAEQGGTDAVGALASLVSQLEGKGTIIAASRRSFFDTEDYMQRAGFIKRAVTAPCLFDEVRLCPWGETEALRYIALNAGKEQAEETYAQILGALGSAPDHPMLTRPFLLTQIVKALTLYNISPDEFIRTADDPLNGVAAVVQAFIRREVADKWKFRETGEPYLTEDQHMQLLADVAEEMYRSQKDRLDLEVIETIAMILMDQWAIEPSRRQQILEMVRMHVLLVRPATGNAQSRSFDHPEFRDYFIAYALASHLGRVMSGESSADLARYLAVAQMSDSTARYVFGMVQRSTERVKNLLAGLEYALQHEWKATFLQVNAGTLVAAAMDGLDLEVELNFKANAIFSSLVFERSVLSDITIEECSFVNISLAGASWKRVTVRNCNLGEVSLDSHASFESVTFEGCVLDGLKIASEGDDPEEVREYAPDRILWRLSQMGVSVATPGLDQATVKPEDDSPLTRLARKVLRLFNRTTTVTELQIRTRFKADQNQIINDLIPILAEHGVVVEKTWRGQGHQRAWNLANRMEDVLHAEGNPHDPKSALWKRLQRG